MSTEAIRNISTQEYESLQLDGYTVDSSQKMRLYKAEGNYVTLRRKFDCCERVARLIGSIVIAPFACITVICCIDPFEKYLMCSAEALDGYEQIKGFVKDNDATETLHKRDYNCLGIGLSDLRNTLKIYLQNQESQGRNPIQSKEFPQHSYFFFYGPISKFSYIILIPNNDLEKVKLFPVCNKNGRPCNSIELNQKAYKLCAGYKDDVTKIVEYTKKVPIASATSNGPYGSVTTTIYENKTFFVST